ncbi:hypothetical protein HY412_02255 [Candidatus Kaiserbacteria bacterium]|nr:hypothetical protein [Candidatus Kaiserbacteria bacterium]
MFKAIASFLDIFSTAWIEYRRFNLRDGEYRVACKTDKDREKYGDDRFLLTDLCYRLSNGGKDIERVITETLRKECHDNGSYYCRDVSELKNSSFPIPRHGKEADLVRQRVRLESISYWDGMVNEKAKLERQIIDEMLETVTEMKKEAEECLEIANVHAIFKNGD